MAIMNKGSLAFVAVASAGLLAASAIAEPSETELRKSIVDTAQKYLGVPYTYGAESPEAFDCSGFVQYVYEHGADMIIPRNSRDQSSAGTPVEKDKAKPGDIFVFDTAGGGDVSHVAIYLGGDHIIHAVSEGPRTGVVITPSNDRYFEPRCLGARYFIVSPFSSGQEQPPETAAKAQRAAPPEQVPKPALSAKASVSEVPIDQVGFVVGPKPEVIADKTPAATGSGIAFTITNGTGRKDVFHVYFYKANVDFKKTQILREDRREIAAGGSVKIDPYIFTEPGVYRLNVKTGSNAQLMQRTWQVVDVKN
jgi:hypothetical protein